VVQMDAQGTPSVQKGLASKQALQVVDVVEVPRGTNRQPTQSNTALLYSLSSPASESMLNKHSENCMEGIKENRMKRQMVTKKQFVDVSKMKMKMKKFFNDTVMTTGKNVLQTHE
jgi:hypothetical protein